MNKSLLYHAFGVREGYDYQRTDYEGGSVIFTLRVQKRMLVCPECGSRNVVRKGKRYRRLQTVPIGFKSVYLKTEVPQCECRECGKTFEVSPPLPTDTCDIPDDLPDSFGD